MVHPHCRCALVKITAFPIVNVEIPVNQGFGKVIPAPAPAPKQKPIISAPPLTSKDIAKVQKVIRLPKMFRESGTREDESRRAERFILEVPNESKLVLKNHRGITRRRESKMK